MNFLNLHRISTFYWKWKTFFHTLQALSGDSLDGTLEGYWRYHEWRNKFQIPEIEILVGLLVTVHRPILWFFTGVCHLSPISWIFRKKICIPISNTNSHCLFICWWIYNETVRITFSDFTLQNSYLYRDMVEDHLSWCLNWIGSDSLLMTVTIQLMS